MRTLRAIAYEIRQEWKKVNYAAEPYLDAMGRLDTIDSAFYQDSGKSIVWYFLCNATSWRGESARRIKAELKGML